MPEPPPPAPPPQPASPRVRYDEAARRHFQDAELLRLAAQEQVDVVLIDSRAGLHDLAAFVVTRLRAQSLLFAAGTEQTWRGYRHLFEGWRSHPQLSSFRDNLRVVAALVPETQRDEYMQRFVESSHALFSETLYEETGEGDMDAFNFDLHDETAPHHPLVVYWSRALQEFDPVKRPEAVPEDQLLGAAGSFCRGIGAMLGMDVLP